MSKVYFSSAVHSSHLQVTHFTSGKSGTDRQPQFHSYGSLAPNGVIQRGQIMLIVSTSPSGLPMLAPLPTVDDILLPPRKRVRDPLDELQQAAQQLFEKSFQQISSVLPGELLFPLATAGAQEATVGAGEEVRENDANIQHNATDASTVVTAAHPPHYIDLIHQTFLNVLIRLMEKTPASAKQCLLLEDVGIASITLQVIRRHRSAARAHEPHPRMKITFSVVEAAVAASETKQSNTIVFHVEDVSSTIKHAAARAALAFQVALLSNATICTPAGYSQACLSVLSLCCHILNVDEFLESSICAQSASAIKETFFGALPQSKDDGRPETWITALRCEKPKPATVYLTGASSELVAWQICAADVRNGTLEAFGLALSAK